VVLKGIELDVTPKKFINALKEHWLSAKNVSNIINWKKEPQPLFSVELEPDSRVLKKNEVHLIYNLKYLSLLIRRCPSADPITVKKHSGSYDGHHATKYDGIYVIYEKDHANTGSKPEHGVTAAYS